MSNLFLPEGSLLDSPENRTRTASLELLQQAAEDRHILEGQALLCTPEHDLRVSVGPFVGVIPREESAIGIREGKTREIAILSRVGKAVSFVVEGISLAGAQPLLHLSRRKAQEMAREHLLSAVPPGSVVPAVVTHLESFGAFVDIGCGFASMVGIENLSVSRISHPARRLTLGQHIHVLVTGANRAQGRIFLSHKELLGTWTENAAEFLPGMTVPGYVRGIKDYGVFVELRPNLTGLADPSLPLAEDQRVSVYIKGILPQRMKIKLLIIRALEAEESPPPLPYRITQGRVSNWRYAPPDCVRAGPAAEFSAAASAAPTDDASCGWALPCLSSQ